MAIVFIAAHLNKFPIDCLFKMPEHASFGTESVLLPKQRRFLRPTAYILICSVLSKFKVTIKIFVKSFISPNMNFLPVRKFSSISNYLSARQCKNDRHKNVQKAG